jgi:hypothetical protein
LLRGIESTALASARRFLVSKEAIDPSAIEPSANLRGIENCTREIQERAASSFSLLRADLQHLLSELTSKAFISSVQQSPLNNPSTLAAQLGGHYQQSAFGDLQKAGELEFLNKNFAFEQLVAPQAVTSHRKGLIGKIITRLKISFNNALRSIFISGYLDAERVFIENLVRHLNSTGRYIDARVGELSERMNFEVARLEDEMRGVEAGNKQSLADLIQSTLSHLEALQDKLNGVKFSELAISSQSSDRDGKSNESE